MVCYQSAPVATLDTAQPKYVTPQYVQPQYSEPQYVKPQYVHATPPPTEPGGTEQVQRLLQYLTEEALPARNGKKPKTVDVGPPPGLQKPSVSVTGCATDMPLGATFGQGPWNSYLPDAGSCRAHLFDHVSGNWGNQAYWSDNFQGDVNTLYPNLMAPSIQSPWPMNQTVWCQTDDLQQERASKKNKTALGSWPKRRCGPLNIASQLVALEGEDEDTVIVVRKINKLGFDSVDILTRHYSAFGRVTKVMLSSTNEKKERGMRLRPAGIGFVVFERSEDALAVLAAGECQAVAGISIVVRPFERTASRNDDGLKADCSDKYFALSQRSTSDSLPQVEECTSDSEGHPGAYASECGSSM